jgi:hypothetical protein
MPRANEESGMRNEEFRPHRPNLDGWVDNSKFKIQNSKFGPHPR